MFTRFRRCLDAGSALVQNHPRYCGGSEPVSPDWFPVSGNHTCLKVAVETQLGETDVDDSGAQENVFTFDTAGASPHKPIFFETNMQNPHNFLIPSPSGFWKP